MTTLLLSMFAPAILNELGPRAASVRVAHDLEQFDLRDSYRREPFELLICFGFNRRLPVEDPMFANVRFVNAHTSLLPYGRGSNPNFCSWLNGEPHGITIHEMATAFDAGAILFQRELSLDPRRETLRSSYFLKVATLIEFIAEKWDDLVHRRYTPRVQDLSAGSRITQKEVARYADLIEQHKERPVSELLAAIAAQAPSQSAQGIA